MSDDRTQTDKNIVESRGRHLRVLGPPASDKTTLLVRRYRHIEAGGGKAAVVTYTKQSRASLTGRLLDRRSARFGALPVYTYHSLAEKVIEAGSGARLRVVAELEQAVILRMLLRRIGRRLESDYRSTIQSSALQDRILKVANTLLQNGVSSACRDALSERAANARVRDLLTIYFEFRKHLHSHDCYTYHEAAWRAVWVASENPAVNPLLGTSVLCIDDFHDVDAGQYALIKALAPPEGDIEVSVFGDPTGARFRGQGTSDRYLLEVFPRDYGPREAVLPAGCANHGSLGPVVDRLLEETLGEEQARVFARTPVASGTRDVEVSLDIAEDGMAEASYVAGRAAELVLSGRFREDQIAVAVRDKRRYESALATAFRDRGLALDTGRREQHPFEYFVYALLRVLDEPGNESARNAVAGSPVFETLRNTARELFAEELPDVPAVCERIRGMTTPAGGVFDLAPFLEGWLRPLLTRISQGGAVAPELLAFLADLAEEWRSYSGAVEGARGRRSLREFLALSRTLVVGGGEERTVRGGQGRVGLYSVHELSARKFPAVIVAGCSETVFPTLPPREEFIPYRALQDSLRSAIEERPVELHLARSNDGFLRDEYALLLTALSRAGERLELTAPRQLRGESAPAPSRVLAPLGRGGGGATAGRAPSVLLRMAAAAVGGGMPPDDVDHDAGRWWRLEAPGPRGVKRRQRAASPSALSIFAVCPRKYFYSRVLRVEEKRSPAMAFGTLFHELMDRLAQRCRTHAELRAAIASAEFESRIDDIIAGSEGFAEATGLEKTAARHHLRAMANRFVELDGARNDGYRIEETEKELAFEHGGMRFSGRADRIDEGTAGRVVIDYKTVKRLPTTGKTIRKKSLAGFDKPDERLWQVPFYSRGACREEGEYPDVFCYYSIKPDGGEVIVGLAVGDVSDAARAAETFGVERKRFDNITPAELEESLDEAAAIARDIFAEREEFERTPDREACARCEYRRICERTS